MKKIVLIIFLVSSLFFACSKKINEPRWVNASAGLSLKIEPSIESKQIDLIPDGEQVLLIKEKKDEVTIDNIKGRWSEINWNNKTGWVFNGFLSNQNFSRWITSKTGLPFTGDSGQDRGLIPLKERVKLVGPSKIKDYVVVAWKGRNVNVRSEFLSQSVDITYDYADLRAVASKNLATTPGQIIYPEDMYIETNNWLYHIIYIYRNQEEKKDYLESLWFKDGNSWKEIEISGSKNEAYNIKMFNLDDDENPDIMVYGGCCDTSDVEVYLGTSDKKLNKIFQAYGILYPEGYDQSQKSEPDPAIIISTGKCDQTVIEFKGKKHTFDCKKKEFI